MTANGYRVLLRGVGVGGDENILKFDCGDGWKTLCF